MKHLLAVILLFSAIPSVISASNGTARDSAKVEGLRDTPYGLVWSGLGPGIGMDYGGFGINYTAFVSKNVGFFGGFGFAYAKIGYDFGTKIRVIPRNGESKLNPYFIGMWGYNAVFTATGEPSLSKIFRGITFGIGTDYRAKPDSKGYWSVAVMVPLPNTGLEDDDVKFYKNWLNQNVPGKWQNWVSVIDFSIGYHYILNRNK
jgi:hypothetical protein